jgi:hypothetical protein
MAYLVSLMWYRIHLLQRTCVAPPRIGKIDGFILLALWVEGIPSYRSVSVASISNECATEALAAPEKNAEYRPAETSPPCVREDQSAGGGFFGGVGESFCGGLWCRLLMWVGRHVASLARESSLSCCSGQ